MKREDRRTAAPKFSGVKWTQIYADRNPWSAAFRQLPEERWGDLSSIASATDEVRRVYLGDFRGWKDL